MTQLFNKRLMNFESAKRHNGRSFGEEDYIYGISRFGWESIMNSPIIKSKERNDCVFIDGYTVPIEYLISIEVEEEYV